MSDWLKDAVDKIEAKVDKLDEKLDAQNATLVKQSVILDEHQRRSTASEENLDLLRKEFGPIKTHVQIVNFVFKAIGFLCTAGGVIIAVLKFVVGT